MRLQALHRAPPQQPTPLVVKLEGRPAASVKPGLESGTRLASDKATMMINHVGVTNVARKR